MEDVTAAGGEEVGDDGEGLGRVGGSGGVGGGVEGGGLGGELGGGLRCRWYVGGWLE